MSQKIYLVHIMLDLIFISLNLSHVGPCCVLGHFRLSFLGQACDDAWSFPNCSFKASRRKKEIALILRPQKIKRLMSIILQNGY